MPDEGKPDGEEKKKMPEALEPDSLEQKMIDKNKTGGEEKVSEASQPDAAEKNMPNGKQPDGEDGDKEKSGAVTKGKKRPRDKTAEKVTFANRCKPKTAHMLSMCEATRKAFNEKIKDVLMHPAKCEPLFYRFCVDSWTDPEKMAEDVFFHQASAMAEDWLKKPGPSASEVGSTQRRQEAKCELHVQAMHVYSCNTHVYLKDLIFLLRVILMYIFSTCTLAWQAWRLLP